MTELEFKRAYIAQFLASYMATHFDEDCIMGHPGERYHNQPIEDAVFNANCAWEQLKKHTQELRSIPDNLFVFENKND